MANNNDYDYDVHQLTPYPKTSPVFWNNLRDMAQNLVGHIDNRLNAIVEVTSFTYDSVGPPDNRATFTGFAFVAGELVTYSSETVTAQNNEYIFATGTAALPSLTTSTSMYDVDGALIGQVTDTDTATPMYNKRDLVSGEYQQYVNEIYRFRAPKTYYTNSHDIVAENTYRIDATGAVVLDSDSTVTIGGSTITITSDAATTAINLNGNVDISETLDVTSLANLDGGIEVYNTENKFTVSTSGAVWCKSTLESDGAATLASATIENLTNGSGGIVLSSSAGVLSDSVNLTFDGTDFKIGSSFSIAQSTGALTGTTINASTINLDSVSLESATATPGASKIGTYADNFNYASIGNVQADMDSIDQELYDHINSSSVHSLSGGTGVTYTNGTISIGQAVSTSSNVTFGNVTLGSTNILKANTYQHTNGTSSFEIETNGDVDFRHDLLIPDNIRADFNSNIRILFNAGGLDFYADSTDLTMTVSDGVVNLPSTTYLYSPNMYSKDVSVYPLTRDVYVSSGGHIGYISSTKDRKENINLLNDVESIIMDVDAVTFTYKSEEENMPLEWGFIAEDLPEELKDSLYLDKDGKIEGFNQTHMIPILWKQVQKLTKKINELTN